MTEDLAGLGNTPAISSDKPKRAVNWGPVSAILVTLLSFGASQVAAILIISAYISSKDLRGEAAQAWLNNNISAQFILTLLVEALAVGLIYQFLRRRHAKLSDIGLVKPQWIDIGRVIAAFAVYFLLYVVLAISVKQLVPSLNLDQNQDIGFKTATTTSQLILVFFSLAVLPPFAEEFMFRGFMYTGLRSKLKPVMAGLITSALFATAHLQFGSGSALLWVAFIDTFVLSVVMVYMREKYATLWPCIGLHMLKNTVAFLTLFVFVSR